MARINYELHLNEEDTVFNEIARELQDQGFLRLKDLEKAVKQQFKLFSCPECGSNDVAGSGVQVNYRKVHLKEENTKKGLVFSRKKTVSLGDRFLIQSVTIKDGLIGLLAGSVKCGHCKWKVKGGSQTTWLSLKDIF